MKDYEHPEARYEALTEAVMEAYRRGFRDEVWRLVGAMADTQAEIDEMYRAEAELLHSKVEAAKLKARTARLAARTGSASPE